MIKPFYQMTSQEKAEYLDNDSKMPSSVILAQNKIQELQQEPDHSSIRKLTDVIKIANTHLNLTLQNIEPDNFIVEYIRYCQGKTDAYMEYHYASAITLLSIAADRVAYVSMRFGVIYLNIWTMCLGLSGISRKTTALKEAKHMAREIRINPALPDSFSTERLISNLAGNPRNYMIKDECVQILQGINKKAYIGDLRDFLCELYDCEDFRKELQPRGKNREPEISHIREPYIILQWATTPENFQNNVSVLDITSGWILRFLLILPLYEKETLDIDQCDEPKTEEYNKVLDHLKKIDLACVKGRKIYMKFSENGMKLFQQWQKECEHNLSKNNLANDASLFARLMPYVYKLAAMFAMGSRDFLKESETFIPYDENAQIKRYNVFMVKDIYVEEAIHHINDYFLPVSVSIVNAIETRQHENIQAKILALLKQAGGACQVRDIMRALHIKRKEFNDHIAALIDSEEIRIEQLETGEGIRECLILN